jgi:hypothetical protein
MSCSGSHLGIMINIKNTKFVKDLKPLGQLKPNCPGIIVGRSSVVYADRKSKMAATTDHSINTGPYGENTEMYSSLKLLVNFNFFFIKTRGSQEPVSFTWL